MVTLVVFVVSIPLPTVAFMQSIERTKSLEVAEDVVATAPALDDPSVPPI